MKRKTPSGRLGGSRTGRGVRGASPGSSRVPAVPGATRASKLEPVPTAPHRAHPAPQTPGVGGSAPRPGESTRGGSPGELPRIDIDAWRAELEHADAMDPCPGLAGSAVGAWSERRRKRWAPFKGLGELLRLEKLEEREAARLEGIEAEQRQAALEALRAIDHLLPELPADHPLACLEAPVRVHKEATPLPTEALA